MRRFFWMRHDVGERRAAMRKLFVVGSLFAVMGMATAKVAGFATFTAVDPTGFADLGSNPDDFPSWLPDTTLTYRFDPSFDAVWPNPAIKDQVRAAFDQWNAADATPDGSAYSYGRANGYQPFGDIRTIAVHELGHVLGMQHPNQAHDVGRNWAISGAGVVAQADLNNELMRSWVNAGDYNHLLTHDELDAFDYMYGTDLSFTETAGAADIVIAAYNPGNPNNWAEGGGSAAYRNPLNAAAGMRFVDGFVHFNQASGDPLGFKSLGINWDYQNVGGKATRAFEIQTRGTNYPSPLFHYDNNGPYRFNTFATSAGDANHKDDLVHRWSNSEGGDLPDSELIHVGLEQDVWDWTVVSAEVIHPDGTRSGAPLLSFHDWNNTIVTGTPASPAVVDSEGPFVGSLDRAGVVRVLAQGFRIVASQTSRVEDLMFADVEGFGLKLDDLNRRKLDELREKQLVEEVKDFGVRQLRKGEDFYIVLEGDAGDLPKEIVAQGNYLLLNRPDLLKRELFVYAGSRAEQQEAMVGTFALLGTDPIVGNRGPWMLGDYNLDGSVDGADLAVWETTFVDPGDHFHAYTPLMADGNQNGFIDGGDLLAWQRQFGKGLPLGEAASAPEPTTLLLALAGGAWLLMRRKGD